ncbi:MAG: hypothetical protein IKO61_11595 [Lachnospiraceae bacterium]|nr:hypothetical protein [Lachnospiraceae bacterium]
MTKEQIQEFTLRTTQENHSGLILVLTDIVRVYMSEALSFYKEGNADEYFRSVELCKRALNELIDCFNPGDLLAYRVVSILRFIYDKLVMSAVRGVPQELDRCASMLDNLRIGFVKLHEIDTDGPVMKNTHQVYAGLTYGKGYLNESVGDTSKRGFTA